MFMKPANTFADNVIAFNTQLEFNGTLPEGIAIMNPFREYPHVLPISSAFYKKYYDDYNPRHFIIGINAGRFGAGLTGVPFTDPIRLETECDIAYPGPKVQELSSVFIYDMIEAFGGVEAFYSRFYINSVSPLGFTSLSKTGKPVNHNYYDSKVLEQSVSGFIEQTMQQQLALGIQRDIAFCLGTGKNFRYLSALNDRQRMFDTIIPLEHPRFVMQYKSKEKDAYIEKYVKAFSLTIQ
jgi:hypothetical protein